MAAAGKVLCLRKSRSLAGRRSPEPVRQGGFCSMVYPVSGSVSAIATMADDYGGCWCALCRIGGKHSGLNQCKEQRA